MHQRRAEAKQGEEHTRRREKHRRLTEELARVADELRYTWDPSSLGEAELRRLDRGTAEVWDRRNRLVEGELTPQQRADLAELATAWAELLRREGRILEAVETERQAPRGDLHAGRTLLREGRWEEAERALSAALVEHPGSFWLHFYSGCCTYRLRRWRDAAAAFRTCLALSPRSARCHVNRALALLELGEVKGAQADLDRAIALEPGLGAAWLQRGRLQVRAGKPTDALRDLKQALVRGADPAGTNAALASVYKALGDPVRAREHRALAKRK